MGSRMQLQTKLQSIIGARADGKQNVYYQPPESIKLNYPCIVYKNGNVNILNADNRPYRFTQLYEITLIEKDADSLMHLKIASEFESVRVDRRFVQNNLYHTTINVYY